MKNWKGNSVVIISILHTLFAISNFGSIYLDMIKNGFFNSATTASSSLAAWFFLFGILMLPLGILIRNFEYKAVPIPLSVVVSLLLLVILGAVVMPVSGFWLLFPPVLVMLYENIR